MRRGSVAIVPLILALMLFFWFIWFLGGENDMLFEINKIEHVQHVQESLIIPAIQERLKLEQANPSWSKAQLDEAVDKYIDEMMKINKIQD